MGLDLQPIKARLARITAGQWEAAFEHPMFCGTTNAVRLRNKTIIVGRDFEENASEDTDFIAHAPSDVTALVAEVERLRIIAEPQF